jgi:hypothetical protein
MICFYSIHHLPIVYFLRRAQRGRLPTCSSSSSSASLTSPSLPPASPEATVTTITRWVRCSCTSRHSCGWGVRRPCRIVGGPPRTRAPTPSAEDVVGVRLPRRPRRRARRGSGDRRRLLLRETCLAPLHSLAHL